MNATTPMKPARRRRSFGILLLGLGLIGVGLSIGRRPPLGENPAVHAGPVANRGEPLRVLAALVAFHGAVSAPPGAVSQPGVPRCDSLGEALAAARQAVEALDPAGPHARGARYFAANPGQQIRAWFSSDGVELASGIATPDGEEPWSLKLRLQAVGREGAMTAITPGGVSGEGNRVEMNYTKTNIAQWFENRQDGLEQGLTLLQAPADGKGEVTVLLAAAGSLRPVAMDGSDRSDGSDGVRFVDATGADVLHYRGLKAWDADGRTLPARMETRGLAGLALVVADAGARYPVTVDPLFANVEARLVERSVAQDFLGSAVALAGDTAVVGAPYEDTLGHADAGSAYVFVRHGTEWHLQAKLAADDPVAEDFFGDSVAISGDTIIVGADWAETGGKANAGKAYVFVRNGAAWSRQATLTAGDVAAEDHFGAAVAVSGDTAVVGAPTDDTLGGEDAGSVYIYVRTGATWVQQSQLKAYDAAEGDLFGTSVAVDGGTAVVGAPGDDMNAGSAYVFVRSGTTWNHEDHLLAPVAAAADGFGCAVAVAGDTAVIGAKGDDTLAGADAGSTQVFVRNGVAWHHQATLAPSNGAAGDAFGSVVALDGETAVVGAPEHATAGQAGSGSAYVFARTGDAWSERAALAASDPAVGDSFGAAVAVSGATAWVGALGDDTEAGMDAGSAHVFVASGVNWVSQAEVVADNSRLEDFFGVAVALAGDTALIGAYYDDTPAGADAGSAYVFVRREMMWAQEAKLSASEGAAGDAFGASVALADGTAFIGASGDDPPSGANAGSVSVFGRRGTGWVEEQTLLAGDGAAGDRFGGCLALAGDTALIGAAGADTAAGVNAGNVYVFRLGGGSWQQETQLHADDAAAGDGFGGAVAVAVAGDTALVGASGANTPAGIDAGKVYVFSRSGAAWTQQARLAAPDAAADDRFGAAVALSGETALVGAPNDNGPAGPQAGSAQVFVRDGADWTAQAKLTASDAAQGDGFGCAVSLVGDTALIGAPFDSLPAGDAAGSAYVFSRNGTVWGEQLKLTAGVDASAGDSFGIAVALAGNTALVGADADATAGPGAGSAYVYLLGELPVITRQPESKVVTPGQSVTFTVSASGYQPLRYQWRKNGFPLEGADSSSYIIPVAELLSQGNYDCVVSNLGGVATSAAAVLTVNALSQFAQTFPSAPPAALGYIIVNLTPPGVGGWRFAGEQQWRASGVPVGGLTTSDRVIECMPVNGYLQPPPEPVSVISGGAPTIISLAYFTTGQSGSGGLSVVLKPDSIAALSEPDTARAQWRLFKPGTNFDPWLNSGEGLSGLVPGSYLVECKPVAGRTTPPPSIVRVENGPASLLTITFFLEEAQTGAPPLVLPFETVVTSGTLPYAYVGQIRNDAGSGSGFVVKPRVVATAGHVVFDDGTLAAATGLQWLFQRDSASHEPKPQLPRGVYLLDDYAAERKAPGVVPGKGTLASQNRDAAALYFLADAGRGGYGGFLASDATDNEFLVSSALKTLVGYPVESLAGFIAGRMYATTPLNARFTRVPDVDHLGRPFRTYTTADLRGSGGISGGPLCVRFEGGNYYPAAVYLGGSGQTVVRSIDSEVIEVFHRAELSSIAGDNNLGGGVTFSSFTSSGTASDPGGIRVRIEPAGARGLFAGWRLGSETAYRFSDTQALGLTAGDYPLQLKPVSSFQIPAGQSVRIEGGKLLELTFTYAPIVAAPAITSANAVTGTRGQPLSYRILASPSADSYSLVGSLPAGLAFDPATGLLSGTPGEAGVFTVTVGAANAGGSGTLALTLTARPAVSNQSATVRLGQSLDFQIVSSEIGAGVNYIATGLPLGVAVDPASGRAAGRPLQAGVFASTVTVSKDGTSAAATFTLTVTATPLEIWRFAHFGTTDNTGDAADTSDPDGDGKVNLEEYAADTDPNNAADFFRTLTATKIATAYTVTAAGKAGRTYVLERNVTLTGGLWTAIDTTGTLAADGPIILTDPTALSNKAFYRLRVSVP